MTTEPAHARIVPTDHPCFDDFVATIAALRAPDGCPWDRAQTHQSIAHNMIEEAYEAVDAIEAVDVAHLREELGDVLLQVVLQSQIASDAGEFDINDVCADVNEKMVRRHPHVFGEAQAANAGDVLDLWDRVKMAEKGAADEAADGAGERREGLLDGVPTSFPALMQAQKISRKAAAAGFINATDCADYLTKKGMPFRDAYKLTGCMVSDCIAADKTLEELTLTQFQSYSPLFGADIYDAIDLVHCCEGRTSYGGPSAASVEKQIALATARLDAWEEENA